MEVTGQIVVLNATEKVSDKFSKRLVVVKTEGDYPQTIPVEFTQDKTAVLDKYSIGDNVTVEFNLRGNEFKGKYYVSLLCWKTSKLDGSSASTNTGDKGDDSLPF